ncbi:LysM peptidoglycan-binding domain-containing protein [Nocardioides sp. zg-536]|uniref:LysM peptidoglycan-binding domain-containing protein n=1 Tax=Nocardioides faecalis TaxID=2803858 RepID=A0A938Y2L3_9ACTN|nr:LysM peptidoglycan-binding domain-containing protein [Nocardioides faecalis]MBM9460711.1 LysM peptidoglycan-binding domain-containing protein [Nocardioides faecalis]MBS4752650.1 LysM peptidoglycan-binding domain-containing protein [Nocardioides faecalis]QVI57915.1 LysM peptidoglycan-binding domain-containing protein [Nocardioides faecalis]
MSGAAERRARAVVVWSLVTGGAAALGAVAAEPARQLLTAPGPDFATLLVQACAAASLLAAAALWGLTTDVVVREVLLRGAGRARAPGRCGPLRTAILTACGVAALAGTTAPAGAHDSPSAPLPGAVLAGLPLPDRATGPAAAPDTAPHTAPDETPNETPGEAPGTVRVRAGDSLWTIAERTVGPEARLVEVASYWRRLQHENRAVLGADPDLVHPGQRLRLPHPRP